MQLCCRTYLRSRSPGCVTGDVWEGFQISAQVRKILDGPWDGRVQPRHISGMRARSHLWSSQTALVLCAVHSSWVSLLTSKQKLYRSPLSKLNDGTSSPLPEHCDNSTLSRKTGPQMERSGRELHSRQCFFVQDAHIPLQLQRQEAARYLQGRIGRHLGVESSGYADLIRWLECLCAPIAACSSPVCWRMLKELRDVLDHRLVQAWSDTHLVSLPGPGVSFPPSASRFRKGAPVQGLSRLYMRMYNLCSWAGL